MKLVVVGKTIHQGEQKLNYLSLFIPFT